MSLVINKFLTTDFSSSNNHLKDMYSSISISYFDHWLSEEEYEKADLISYADTREYPEKTQLYNKIRDQFILFYKLLYELGNKDVYVSFSRYWSNIEDVENPVKITSYNDYHAYIINALKEERLCCLLYPRLKSIIFTGYDLTHELYILKDSQDTTLSTMKKIEHIINTSKLHII